MNALEVVGVVGIVFVAAATQGAIGFGQNLLAAPLVTLIDDRFVPGPLLVALLVTGAVIARREHRSIDTRGVASALTGLVPATAAGVVVLDLLDADATAVLFSLLVLVAVALSAAGLHVPPSPPAVLGAGAAAGLMQSITSIPGAPLALVYQREEGPTIRATLAVIFVAASLVAVAALAIGGRFGQTEALLSVLVAPAAAIGALLSEPLARHADARGLRPLLLAVVTAAAIGGLARVVSG